MALLALLVLVAMSKRAGVGQKTPGTHQSTENGRFSSTTTSGQPTSRHSDPQSDDSNCISQGILSLHYVGRRRPVNNDIGLGRISRYPFLTDNVPKESNLPLQQPALAWLQF